jgi:hypothetical protein
MEGFEANIRAERATAYRIKALKALVVAAESSDTAKRREFLRLAQNWHVLARRIEAESQDRARENREDQAGHAPASAWS